VCCPVSDIPKLWYGDVPGGAPNHTVPYFLAVLVMGVVSFALLGLILKSKTKERTALLLVVINGALAGAIIELLLVALLKIDVSLMTILSFIITSVVTYLLASKGLKLGKRELIILAVITGILCNLGTASILEMFVYRWLYPPTHMNIRGLSLG